MRRRIAQTLLIFFALTIVALPVFAQSGASADAETEPLLERARAHQQKREWQAALELYREAWKQKKTHDIAANMAQVELALGLYRDACEHLAYALAFGPMEPTPKDEKIREISKQELDKARRRVGQIVFNLGEPKSEATLTIDGEPFNADRSPWGAYLDPGEHRVEARYGSAAPETRKLTLAAGEKQTLSFVDPRKSAEEKQSSNEALLASAAPATPPKTETPPSGPLGMTETQYVLVLTSAQLALLAAGTGVVLLRKSSDTEERRAALSRDLEARAGNDNPCFNPPAERAASCERLGELADRVGTERNFAIGSFVVAGIGAAGAVSAWLLWPKSSAKKSAVRHGAWLGASLARGGGAWTLGGRF